ncbi:MAG: DUF4837 family protein [Prevotellaceae bacterium]|jgi:hypothetical protein|nr:DUF4837 family protein [Prevotellaceae bacterium]
MKATIKYLTLVSILASLLAFLSCNENKSGSVMPGITGKLGEIYVIIEKPLWDSEIGDTIRGIFTQAYPMLPQTEPMFKLMSVPYSSFSRAFQRHRNLIVVNVVPEDTITKINILYDRWATPQIVINASGHDARSIALKFDEQRKTLLTYMEQAELDRQTANAIKYEDRSLREAVEKKFGVRIFIPQGFRKLPVSSDANFMWFTNRNNYVDMGIFIYTFPFTSDSTFTVDYLVDKRNEFLKQYVLGDLDSSWMITSPVVTPHLEIKSFKGQTYGEMRGLWDVENGFMGGPFISRSYVDNVNRRIVMVDGYVFAARYDKRDYMRRLEGVINTFTLTIPQAADATGENKNDAGSGQTSSASFSLLRESNGAKKYFATCRIG